jgi:hypothetical protein
LPAREFLRNLCQAAIAPKPGKEAFDHPAPGMDGKADLAGLLADALDDDSGCGRREGLD